MFSAFYSTIFSSKSEREAVRSKLVQFPIKGGRITSRYGNRKDPLNKKENQHHKGIDIGAPMYSPIKSIMTGKVSGRGRTRNGGLYITILHSNGYSSTYRHCSKIMLEIGDEAQLPFFPSFRLRL